MANITSPRDSVEAESGIVPNERHEASEYTPLVNGHHTNQSRRLSLAASDVDTILSEDGTKRSTLILHEFVVLFKGAVPVLLAYCLQQSISTVSIIIVGRRSPADLSTAAFAYIFALCTGGLIGTGGSTALDTLASSAFTGSKDKHDLGILLQRAFLVLGLCYIPIAFLWAFSRPLFLALGQTERLSTDVAQFLTYMIPGQLGWVYFEAMKKYLQAQGIMQAGTYILLVTSPISALLNYLFVYTAGWGIAGAPFASGIGYWLSFFGLVLYTRFVAGSECWGGWSKRCFQNLGVFSKLAFLGFIQVGTEWWAFEIVAIAAGRLGSLPLAAQSCIMTADEILNTIPFGIGVAASARVGNMLGARNARGAARAANISAWLSVFIGALVLAFLLVTRTVFAKIFTNDDAVAQLVSETIPYVALFQIADGVCGSCGGALRGMGRQSVGAGINLISYYCIALPLGIYLAFHGWGLPGLWLGQCIALYLVGIGEWAIIYFTNWEKQVEKAFTRMEFDIPE